MAQTQDEAVQLAQELGQQNRMRQALTAELTQKAREQVLAEGVGPILIVAGSEYVAGVAGLVASRLAEEFYRPAIVVERGETESKGSCRSIPEFHITEALDSCAQLLVRHGGHAAAAGFTIRHEPWDAFTARLRQIAQERLERVELTPRLHIDAELPIAEVNWATVGLLAQLEPFGQGNPTPLLLSRNVQVRDHRVAGGKHLALVLSDGRVALDAIAFGMGDRAATLASRIDVVYTLGVDEWNGQQRLKLFVRDFRPADEPREGN